MKCKKLIFSAVCLLGLGLIGLHAQESVNAAGGNALGGEGSISYSVVQVFYTSNTGENGKVSQGVQQPFEISEVMSVKEAKGINLLVSVYPNPTTDYLTLKIDNFELSNLSYQILDIQGRLLESKKIEGNQTSIVICNLVSATYFVKVTQGNTEVKTFKIIKK